MNAIHKLNLRTLTVLIVMLAIAPLTALAAGDGSDILSACASRIRSAKGISAEFTMKQSNGGSTAGDLTMSGKKFRLITPQMSVWYNGKDQWSYLSAAGEVNITEPTPEELLETNPFEVIVSYDKRYKCRLLKAEAGYDRVELTPAGKDNAIKSAKIAISRKTGWPVEIKVLFDNGQAADIRIGSVKTHTEAIPASVFTFNAKAYPGIDVVDLR